MENRSRLEQANDNAAGFWLAQARVNGWEYLHRPGLTAVRCARSAADPHRVVITDPYGESAVLEEELSELLNSWRTTQLCLEDPYRRLDLSRFGCVHGLDMAIMVREPVVVPGPNAMPGSPLVPGSALGPGSALAPGQAVVVGSAAGSTGSVGTAGWGGRRRYGDELTVAQAVDGEGLAAAERTVVEGFPVPAHQPAVRGGMLAEGLLDEPGLRAWLAEVDGQEAGACLTYDNGTTVGVYWVATLPGHRSRGVARALVEAALAAHPDRPAVLVATLLAEPLYRKLGFVEQGVTRWWGYPAAPEAYPSGA
ncbi:GNAT family N-acetyltransferase [Kitasatospora sp. NPDC057015]|uniref:GNAT family N-acetyltransferase n=1 Tax=Kitasatospora sp. NPDC057015 TaxID=3346001 RepID=UPI0036295DC4